ncbi:2-deoxy-scyllo-inosose synthase [Photorhabdus cinerea]|uniref:3-dehydroquinate synthase n=1 Tax=Photorhabdus cinerea TaxID=471575 RepID=A0A7X5TI11_9GAMM|nr:2-deoxy-scyllo-inosose synthase [Photorhabdus cinerea]NHB92779.1 3-dehydroquinate synthase [Photorhabdus cinerea]
MKNSEIQSAELPLESNALLPEKNSDLAWLQLHQHHTRSMHKIDLCFEDVAYPFWVGSHCTEEIVEHLTKMSASSLHIITDNTVNKLHVEPFVRQLKVSSRVWVWPIPDGEANKSLKTLDYLANQLLNVGVDRKSVVIAIGGGVVGNIAGLLAALLFRGIRLVHIPTTLLAMSDSVISLKQAVNMPQGKNLIGCFHTPEAVFADTAFLLTLPTQHLRSGLCEIIKNVLTLEAENLSLLTNTLNAESRYDELTLTRIVQAGVLTKQRVMINDKRERHHALVFEYGHTVGHAIELICNGKLTHGEAVGLGMIVAAEVSHSLGLLTAEERDMHYHLLQLNGVEIKAPIGTTLEAVMKVLQSDNKRGYLHTTPNEIPMILLRGLGMPLWSHEGHPLTPVHADLLESMLRRHIFHSV